MININNRVVPELPPVSKISLLSILDTANVKPWVESIKPKTAQDIIGQSMARLEFIDGEQNTSSTMEKEIQPGEIFVAMEKFKKEYLQKYWTQHYSDSGEMVEVCH